MTVPYVMVSGPGSANEREKAWAEEVGRLLAQAGAVVLCGGLGGVMDAVVRGVRSAGGISVGILPGDTRDGASDSLTVALPTGMGETRNALLVRAADVVIAISGEFGTLSEIAFALKIGRPVVGLATWELAKGGRNVDAFRSVETPARAVDLAISLARG